jgi:hypothetical protein
MPHSFTADRQRLTALRLSAQGIAAPGLTSPAAVVRHLLAMQAQDYAGALWSVGLRTPSCTAADVTRALADREIVRSWPMRGTLHLTAAEDLGWMLQLTGARIFASAAGRHRQLGLEEAHFTLARSTAETELGGGVILSRTALLAAFASAGIDVTGQRGSHLLLALSVRGVLVFGPADGTTQTFALLDEWVQHPRHLDADEALAEFVLRYFEGHGPATIRDFAWWSSLTLTDARRGLALVEAVLERLEVDGVIYYHRGGLEPALPGVHALPGFDEYVLGYQDRGAQLAPEFFEAIVPGANGMFRSTVVVDGQIVGTWRRSMTAKAVTVEVEPLLPLSARSRTRFNRALARYGDFVGLPVHPV